MNTVIAHRKTADNKSFLVWEDGEVTQALGYFWPGIRKLPVGLALIVADEVCLYDAAEVPALLKAARKLNKTAPFTPGELRALAHELASK